MNKTDERVLRAWLPRRAGLGGDNGHQSGETDQRRETGKERAARAHEVPLPT
ncbi:MAG TPA: hypothetical protein VIY49_34420 [Bryobacteraceae bacterium]